MARKVSEEEGALFKSAMRGVKPIRRRARKDGDAPSKPAVSRKPALKAAAAKPKQKTPETRPAKSAVPAPSVFDSGDPKTEKRARQGRLAIERRLDLHGLTEAAAFARLSSFLETARHEGCRTVLVITGKGASVDRLTLMGDTSPRGVLRARFLDWVESAPLRALIARVGKAGPRHGGAGAFYLFLKRKRG
jgi:DNA-nicking Smr family endonuclease